MHDLSNRAKHGVLAMKCVGVDRCADELVCDIARLAHTSFKMASPDMYQVLEDYTVKFGSKVQPRSRGPRAAALASRDIVVFAPGGPQVASFYPLPCGCAMCVAEAVCGCGRWRLGAEMRNETAATTERRHFFRSTTVICDILGYTIPENQFSHYLYHGSPRHVLSSAPPQSLSSTHQ